MFITLPFLSYFYLTFFSCRHFSSSFDSFFLMLVVSPNVVGLVASLHSFFYYRHNFVMSFFCLSHRCFIYILSENAICQGRERHLFFDHHNKRAAVSTLHTWWVHMLLNVHRNHKAYWGRVEGMKGVWRWGTREIIRLS